MALVTQQVMNCYKEGMFDTILAIEADFLLLLL